MKTIEIKTTQNVTIEYQLASLRERSLAFFIDILIVFAVYIILIFVLISTIGELLGESSTSWYITGFALPVGGFLLYQLLSEILSNGQSLGKKSMGIKVVRLDGREPGLSDYLLRVVFHIVDSLASMGIVAALLISSSNKNQRLGDMTANTAVIKTKNSQQFQLEDILGINTLKNYVPKYSNVTNLSEDDMLLIKNVVSRYRKYRNSAHRKLVHTLTEKACSMLDIKEPPTDKVEFLKTLIRDYIVLTR
ncbi:MAG: RDD family protein [Bacteroidetes bacterium]|nr:RDD family protein [Bacteroidota bacterium]